MLSTTRADSSSYRLPLKFPPVDRSRRENHQEISTKNVSARFRVHPKNLGEPRPQKAGTCFTYTGGVGAPRADPSSHRLPLKFSPVGRSRRENHQEISTKNVSEKFRVHPKNLGDPNFWAKRFSSISHRGFRASTCRRVKIQGAAVGYSNPRASVQRALIFEKKSRPNCAHFFYLFAENRFKARRFFKIMNPKMPKFF